MPSAGRRIAVGKREIEPVVTRLSSMYELAAARVGADGANVRQEETAVWCIGETLAACGGYDLMWLAFRAVEERDGSACAAWLDRSWDGITIPEVVLWSANHTDQEQA